MSYADYEICPGCDGKAVYMGDGEFPEGVAAWHEACLRQHVAGAVTAERKRSLLSIAEEIDLLADEFAEPDSSAGTLRYVAERATFPAIREGIRGAAELARTAAEPQP